MKNLLAKTIFAVACCFCLISTAFADQGGYIPFPTSQAATPHNCPGNQHWVTTGTGIAHCVLNDFVCPFAQHLVHDATGNPSCVPNTCPSNQVLQPDGVSCACPAALPVWNGASCVAPVSPAALGITASQVQHYQEWSMGSLMSESYTTVAVPVANGMLVSDYPEGTGITITSTDFVVTNTGGGILSIGTAPGTCNGANLASGQACTFSKGFGGGSVLGGSTYSGIVSISTNSGNLVFSIYGHYMWTGGGA